MAEQENQETQSPGKLKSILVYGYVLFNLGGMGLGSFLVYNATLGYKKPSITSAELNREISAFQKSLQDKPMLYTLDKMTTNLSGLPRRAIRLEINLEMLDGEGFEEVIALGAKGRDILVQTLNGKTFSELETVQGKLQLKNEMIAQLNHLLKNGVVQNIYFSEFVVQ